MSVESAFMTALSATGLPIAQGIYTGTDKTYMTFDYWSIPIWNQDDAPECERVVISLNLFAQAKTNLTALKKQIKTLLFAAGYTYPIERDMSTQDYGRQIVFETETRVVI